MHDTDSGISVTEEGLEESTRQPGVAKALEDESFFDLPDKKTLKLWLDKQRETCPWYGDFVHILSSSLGFYSLLRFLKREDGDDIGPGGNISNLLFLSECFKFRNDYMAMRAEANRIVRVFMDNHKPLFLAESTMADFSFVCHLCWRSKDEGLHQENLEDDRHEIQKDTDPHAQRLVQCSNMLVYSIKERLSGDSFAVAGNEFDDAEKVALLSILDSGSVDSYFASDDYVELLQYFYARMVPREVDDFHMYGTLHQSRFGTTIVASRLCSTGGHFCLKRMPLPSSSSSFSVRQAFMECVWREIRCLSQVPLNDFMQNLYWSFRGDDSLFLVLSILNGGNLHTHVKQRGPFDDQTIRYFTSRASLALAHLHAEGFVFRNMSPKNVVLNEFGKSYLADFSFAVRVFDTSPPRGVYGNKGYIAPEMFAVGPDGVPKFYGVTSDWFGIGCLVHFMATASSPFVTNDAIAFAEELQEHGVDTRLSRPEDVATLHFDPFTGGFAEGDSAGKLLSNLVAGIRYKRRQSITIKETTEELPTKDKVSNCVGEAYSHLSANLVTFTKALLVKEPSKRLGAHDVQQVLGHDFFHGYNLEGIAFNNVVPPFKPVIPERSVAGIPKRNSSVVPPNNEHTTYNHDLSTVHMGTGMKDTLTEGPESLRYAANSAQPFPKTFEDWRFNNECVIDFEFLRYILTKLDRCKNIEKINADTSLPERKGTPTLRERRRRSFISGDARIAVETPRSPAVEGQVLSKPASEKDVPKQKTMAAVPAPRKRSTCAVS